MAAKLRALEIDIGVNLANLSRDLGNATTTINNWAAKMGSKLDKLPISPQISPEVESKSATKDVESIGSSLLPLGSQIGSSLTAALAPLNAFAGRFESQFDKVGATIIALSRRIDSAMKFPVFDKAVSGIRDKLNNGLTQAEGAVGKFARGADKALSGIQGFVKLKNMIGSIGDVAGKTIGKLTKLKPPIFNFSSSTTSITNMGAATQAATNGFKSMAGQAALALGVFGLGYKAVGWLKEGVKGAVDLGETISKVETVFGDASKGVIANADEMANAYGLPTQSLLDAAAGIGLVGKAAGYSQKDAADLGSDMAKLAADASSFYNVPIEEALTAMRSGLVGEAEPLRRFGVLLSEDAVKAEAMRLGLAKAGGELSEQAKVTARASLITKGLTDASGDLARTQGSAANQGRKFTGSLSNLAVSVGQTLMPALTKGLGLLNEFATWAGSKFEANKAVFEGWGQTLMGVFDRVASSVKGGFQPVMTFLGEMLPSFAQISSAVKTTIGTIQSGFAGLKSIFDSVFGSEAGGVIGGFVKQFGGIAVVAAVAVPVLGVVVSTLGGLLGILTSAPVLIGAAVAGVAALTAGFVDWSAVIDTAGFAIRNIGEIWSIAQAMIGQKLTLLLDTFELIPTNLKVIGKWITTDFVSVVGEAFKAIGKMIASVATAFWDWLKNPSGGLHFDFTSITTDLEKALANIETFVNATPIDISGTLGQQFDAIAQKEEEFRKNMAKGAMPMPAKEAEKAAVKKGVLDPDAKEPLNVKAMKELDQFAKKFKDDVQTPFQKYNEAITKAREAHDKGLITDAEFAKAPQFARKEAGLDGEPKFAAAADINSKEAYSSIISAMSGRANGVTNVEKAGMDTAKNTLSIAKSVGILAAKAINPQVEKAIAK